MPDVALNKPFKGRIEEFYDDWLGNGKHEYMEAANMESWQDVSNETLAKTMKSCGLALAVDSTQDDLISRFEEGQKLAVGKTLLKTQMLNLNDKTLNENQFEISEEDMAAAAPSFNVMNGEDDVFELDIM